MLVQLPQPLATKLNTFDDDGDDDDDAKIMQVVAAANFNAVEGRAAGAAEGGAAQGRINSSNSSR